MNRGSGWRRWKPIIYAPGTVMITMKTPEVGVLSMATPTWQFASSRLPESRIAYLLALPIGGIGSVKIGRPEPRQVRTAVSRAW